MAKAAKAAKAAKMTTHTPFRLNGTSSTPVHLTN